MILLVKTGYNIYSDVSYKKKAVLVHVNKFWVFSVPFKPKFSLKLTQMLQILYCFILADFGVSDGKKKLLNKQKNFINFQ